MSIQEFGPSAGVCAKEFGCDTGVELMIFCQQVREMSPSISGLYRSTSGKNSNIHFPQPGEGLYYNDKYHTQCHKFNFIILNSPSSHLTIAPSLRQGYWALSSPSCLRLIVPTVMGSSG